jgi:VRR-NUC domain
LPTALTNSTRIGSIRIDINGSCGFMVPEIVRQCLSSCFRASGPICVPMLLIERTANSERIGIGTAADRALDYFSTDGFVGDRSRANGYGYGGLLRELQSPPPWVTVEMEDCEEQVSAERNLELRALAEQIQNLTDEELLERFRGHKAELSKVLPEYVRTDLNFLKMKGELEQDSFRNLVGLARTLGSDLALALYRAVFHEVDGIYEDEIVTAGAPDLLIWLPDGASGFWFFSEVKAPGDCLRPSQIAWLKHNWDVVGGHYLVSILA